MRDHENTEGAGSRDADTALLLREISRDVAHELRGPVQSAVVNIEVLRRRVRNGAADEALERANVLEQEFLRMHRVVDAFIALLAMPEPELHTVAAERVLAGVDPLLDLLARSARIGLTRAAIDPRVLLRVRVVPAALALVRLFLGARAACGEAGRISLLASADETDLDIRIEPVPREGTIMADSPAFLERAIAGAARWLHDAGGTAGVVEGSDTRASITVRLTRAT